MAEGAQDRNLNKITPTMVKDLLSNDLKLDTRITTLGHVQRGGNACAYDRMLSTLQGVEAVRAVLDATPETPTPVICIDENKIVRKPLVDAVKATWEVADCIKAKDFNKAMSLRDAEFKEYWDAFQITTATDQPELLLPQEKVRISSLISTLVVETESDTAKSWNPRKYPSIFRALLTYQAAIFGRSGILCGGRHGKCVASFLNREVRETC